jgi:hypothetical protein
MIPLFASHLRIEPGSNPVATANSVFGLVEDWISAVVDRGPVSLPLAGGAIEPAPGCRIQLRLDEDRGGWTLGFERREAVGTVETAIRLRVGETGLELGLLDVTPGEPESWRPVRSPAVLSALLEKHATRAGRIDLPAGTTMLAAPAVEEWVEELVLAPDRTVPLVAISQDDYLGAPLVDPEQIARRLAGLARVFVLEDKSASYALTRAVGDKTLGCYLGAVRLYLPGFSLECDPREHLLLVPSRLRQMAGRAGSAADQLLAETMGRFPGWLKPRGPLAELLAATTIRSRPRSTPPAPRPSEEPGGAHAATVVRSTVARSEPAPFTPPPTALGLLPRLRELVEENRVLFARNDELEKRIVEAEAERQLFADEVQQVETRLDAAEERALDLEVKLADAAREIADLRFVIDRVRGEHPELFEQEPETVIEAVERIAALKDPTLVFLPSAFASAEDSPYQFPKKVLSALQALAEVARKRRRVAESGAGMGTWPVQLFESRGIRYASHNSGSTKARWSGEYRVVYDGKRVELDEHLSLGASHDPAACLRIYFFWDPDRRVTVVAHVGRHKRNTLT